MMEEKKLSRRRFISLGAKAIVLTAFGGLELLTSEAEARRKSQPVEVVLDYQTILGNNQREDQVAQLRLLTDHYRKLAHFYSGGVLAIPEDASIIAVKPQRLRVTIDQNQAESGRQTRVVSENKPKWDERAGKYIINRTLELDLRRYTMNRDEMLADLVNTVTEGYPTPEEKAQALLCFVQTAIGYDHEKVDQSERNLRSDYVRNPMRTLLDKKGDCKDTSVLYASLLAQIGISPVFLMYDYHVNVGVPLDFQGKPLKFAPESLNLDGKVVHKSKSYFIAETTPESPMYIGKEMVAQRGKKVERILSAFI